MTEKLKELTPEQEALQHVVAKEWIDKSYETTSLDKEKFERGVSWLYTDMLKLKTPDIVYCDSWEDALNRICDYNEVEDSERANYKNDIKSKHSFYSSLPYASYWVAFFDYFQRIGVLQHDLFDKYKDYISSGVFSCYEFEKAIFAIHPPVATKRDEQDRLHCIDGQAITFRDGTGYYAINGRGISEKNFMAIRNKTYTVEDFVSEGNEEVKSSCLNAIQEIHGGEFLVHLFADHLKEVDTYVDKKEELYLTGTTKGMNIGVYTLFSGELNGDKLNYVRCYCPSTDRMFFLGAEPHYKTAKDAIASLCRIPTKLTLGKDIKYITRQGERFALVLSDTGKRKAKTLTQSECQDTRALTGDEYFSNIRYEY